MKRIYISAILILLAFVANAQVYNVLDYGAKGDGKADDAAAIQRAVDKCSADGGGQVLLPVGRTFLAGPIQLKSNVDFHLSVNSTLKCNPDESIYHLSAFGANEGEGMKWIYTLGAENLSISGKGTIDGSGVEFMGKELDDSYELKPLNGPFDPRPHVLTLEGVKNLRIHDVTIRNGAYWTVHLIGCYDAVIDGISLLNNLKIRNGDGIDVDHSRKVRISNCLIESGDDCICLKNRREFEKYGPCQDIVVTNCVMTSRSCAIKIGSENMDSISHILFDNCIIRASNRGLGIQNRDEGTVTNVMFSNMIVEGKFFSDVWWGKAEPIYITSYPRAVGNHKDAGWRFPKGATEGRCGEVSDIAFCNVQCYSPNGIFLGCDTEGKVNNIRFDNVVMHKTSCVSNSEQSQPGIYDRRPCVGEGFVSGDPNIYIEKTVTKVDVSGIK